MPDTRIYGRYMLVAIPEKGEPFKVSEVATLCQAQDERGEWQEHYGCDVVFFEVPEGADSWSCYVKGVRVSEATTCVRVAEATTSRLEMFVRSDPNPRIVQKEA